MYKLIQYCHFTKLRLCERFYTSKQLCTQLSITTGAIRYALDHKSGCFCRWIPNTTIVKINPSDLPSDTLVDDQGIPFKFVSNING